MAHRAHCTTRQQDPQAQTRTGFICCLSFALSSHAHRAQTCKHQIDNRQHAQSTTLQRCRTQAPAGNIVREWHTHLGCTAVGSCFIEAVVCSPPPIFHFLLLLCVCDISRLTLEWRVQFRSQWDQGAKTTVRALHLPREGFSTFFPRRLEPNCAYPRY